MNHTLHKTEALVDVANKFSIELDFVNLNCFIKNKKTEKLGAQNLLPYRSLNVKKVQN